MKKLYSEKPFWIVWYGVDSRHLTECSGVFNTLREATQLNRVTEQPHTIRVIKEVLI